MSTSRAGSRSSQVNPEARPTYAPSLPSSVISPLFSGGLLVVLGLVDVLSPLVLQLPHPHHFGIGAAMEALFGPTEVDEV